MDDEIVLKTENPVNSTPGYRTAMPQNRPESANIYGIPVKTLGQSMSVTDLVKLVRVKQYTKNVFVFAAYIFYVEGWQTPGAIKAVLLAFAAMCCASSTTYIANDIYDIEKDRNHPVKKNRPLPSGRVPVLAAFTMAVVLLVASVVLGFLSNIQVVYGLAAYLLIQVMYNLWLRNKSVADVACISLGFVIRVVIGALAISAHVSGWILLCTATLALMLGFGKRRHEYILMGDDAHTSRKSLAEYTHQSLDMLVMFSATCAALTYSVYSIESPTARSYPGIILTTPFVIYGIARYIVIVFGSGESGEPESMVLRDPHLIVTFVGFAAAAAIGLTNVPLPFLYR
ncbi:MAG: decaprenyl-phosphate phosphoribosyltransferase [Armatimonadetes bacterium]|nr:decaprenyl-phosphate phosphoribosyltransferase [Armatimonadota bacterium]